MYVCMYYVFFLPSSRRCKNSHGLIRKYGLNLCRRCFREHAEDIGFMKVINEYDSLNKLIVTILPEWPSSKQGTSQLDKVTMWFIIELLL